MNKEFPELAQKFLNSFYEAKSINSNDSINKIKSLRTGFGLEDAVLTVTDNELKTLEFYVLTKIGLI